MPRPDAPDYGRRRLARGLEGRDVWELQIKLIGWGSGTHTDGIGVAMDPVRVTGEFDGTTAYAVRRFQKAHSLPVSGVVDGRTFEMIDREQVAHPVSVLDLKCPCASGKNADAILCRCPEHPEPAPCTGFGNGRFAGQLTIEEALAGAKLDLYDKQEHAGIDKALLWAVRALMHRAGLRRIRVLEGYRCWCDNYHTTDDTRWSHRKSTFHLGKAIAFVQPEICPDPPNANASCGHCDSVRAAAMDVCGFQLRWHGPNRVSIADGAIDARPPAYPHAVLVDTVRRVGREPDDFVQTDNDAVAPLYPGMLGLSYPVEQDTAGLDPLGRATEPYFENAESKLGGWFPLGKNRIWHGGIHMQQGEGRPVHAMFDGDVVACRMGDDPAQHRHGSRNFVLVRSRWKDKTFFTLYMHVENGRNDQAPVPWVFQRLRPLVLRHVEALAPSPIFTRSASGALLATAGLCIGERAPVDGDPLDPKTLDGTAPADSQVIKLTKPKDSYLYLRRAGVETARVHDANDGLKAKLSARSIVGLATPVPVRAGELLGYVGPAPEGSTGSYVHVECFAADNLLTGAGYVTIEVAAGEIADRQKAVAKLVEKGLLEEPPDGVLTPNDVEWLGAGASRDRLRSVVLRMPNAWGLDWKKALADAKPLSFMTDEARDELAAEMDAYRFWKEARDGGAELPANETVHHFHPLVLLMQMAFEHEIELDPEMQETEPKGAAAQKATLEAAKESGSALCEKCKS